MERILHQTGVEHEAPQEIPEMKPSDVWPSRGEIEFRYLYFIVAIYYTANRTVEGDIPLGTGLNSTRYLGTSR